MLPTTPTRRLPWKTCRRVSASVAQAAAPRDSTHGDRAGTLTPGLPPDDVATRPFTAADRQNEEVDDTLDDGEARCTASGPPGHDRLPRRQPSRRRPTHAARVTPGIVLTDWSHCTGHMKPLQNGRILALPLPQRRRVLIVDDEPSICRALTIALSRGGYEAQPRTRAKPRTRSADRALRRVWCSTSGYRTSAVTSCSISPSHYSRTCVARPCSSQVTSPNGLRHSSTIASARSCANHSSSRMCWPLSRRSARASRHRSQHRESRSPWCTGVAPSCPTRPAPRIGRQHGRQQESLSVRPSTVAASPKPGPVPRSGLAPSLGCGVPIHLECHLECGGIVLRTRQTRGIVCEVCSCQIVVRKLVAHASPTFDPAARSGFGQSPQMPCCPAMRIEGAARYRRARRRASGPRPVSQYAFASAIMRAYVGRVYLDDTFVHEAPPSRGPRRYRSDRGEQRLRGAVSE